MLRTLGLAAFLSVLLLPCLAPAQTQDDFFDDTVLQEVRITMNPADLATLKLRYLENTRYPVVFRWRNVSVDAAVKSRGVGSRSAVKPGLDVYFDYFDPAGRFLGLRRVDLVNNVQDASMLRERLAQKIFARMGLPASRSVHGRVYVNDEYLGLFDFIEAIDLVYLQNHLGENTGDLFKYVYPTTASPWHFTYKGPDLSQYVPIPFKPETRVDFPNSAAIENWVRTINNSTPSNFQSEAARVMDVRQALTFVAIEAAVAEVDGFIGDYGVNNFYPYRGASSRVFIFLPWDHDNSFWTIDRSIFSHASENVLTRKALEIPELKTFFLQQVVRAAMIQDSFMAAEIEREYALIQQAAYEDSHKFRLGPDNNQTPSSNADFDADVNYLRSFARQRLAVVLREAAQNGYSLPTLSASFPASRLRFGAVTGNTPAAQTVSLSGTNPANQNFTVTVSSGASWLSVSPTAGSTPASLTVSINPGSLGVGDYSATITVTSGAGASAVNIPVLFSIVPPGSEPVLQQGSAVNAATNLGALLAPGSFISVYGQKLASDSVGASLPIPTELAGGSISINGVLAPVLFASPGQMNVQVPWETQAGTAMLTALFKGVASNSITVNIGAYSPGIFVIVYPDLALVDSRRPAGAGDILVVYANGLGPVSPSVATGAQSPSDTLARTTQTPTVMIGGVNAEVQFSGLTPVLVGLYQINVRVPAGVTPGAATPVVVQIGGQSSPPKTIATR